MEKIDTISIVIGGLPSVGKTAITLQFTRNIFPIDYDPSTRGTFQRYLTIGGKNVLVKITDAGYEFGNNFAPHIKIVFFKKSRKWVQKIPLLFPSPN